ncbi:MAG TPA: PHP domain-containing protein [Candidatus Krumholzibacteria bacterium]
MTTRNVRPFVHLRVLSSYSLGLGLSSPGDICRHARRSGFDAVALTDVSGTYGFVEFHRAAREAGIKPIYGALVFLDWRAPGEAHEPVQSLVVLALDRAGLRNVCAIASASAVRRERREGLFCSHLDGLTDGVVAIARVDPAASELDARHLLAPLHDLFGDRLFLEVRAGLPDEQRRVQDAAIAGAAGLGVSSVLMQDVRFVGPARTQLFDLLSSLDETGFEHRASSDRRAGDPSARHAMATAGEISEAYDELPEAFTNAALIASLVQPDLFEALEEAPAAAPSDMFSASATGSLRARVLGLDANDTQLLAPEERAVSRTRIEHELDLVDRAGMEPVIARFERLVGLLRDVGARLGPATGLGVQSRCAYLLGITSFDPYTLDPRFEPVFASPGEADARAGGVFDLQISTEDRPAVLAIVNRAFTGASVGYVPTVEHLTAARSMRMAARWLEAPVEGIDDAIKAATRTQGATLRDLAEHNRAFATLYRRSAGFRELVAHAASVEGLPFGFVRSKRTVIVSPRPLRDFFGYTVSPATGDHFVQATRDSFPLGAVLRIDLALLRILAILPPGSAAQAIDPRAYALIDREDLDGIHLLEGAPGRIAPSFGITSFDDLVSFLALLRWRGSGMTLANRLAAFRGEAHPLPAADQVGETLAPTRGLVLFRDQLRDVAAALAGWSRAEASQFLARLADRSPGNLAAMRRDFFKRTVEQSVSLEDATEWFARLVHESAWVVDRQRVIADALLTARCLHMKWTDREAFMQRVAEHADERRGRHEPQRGGSPDEADEAAILVAPDPATPRPPDGEPDLLAGLSKKDEDPTNSSPVRNPKQGFVVLTTVSEFHPHPVSVPVQLAGRIRNLQTFRSSANKRVGYFELTDSSGSVRVFVPAEPLARSAETIRDGNEVVVRGTVRQRDGRRVCDALEILGSEGGIDVGQASSDRSATGDS